MVPKAGPDPHQENTGTLAKIDRTGWCKKERKRIFHLKNRPQHQPARSRKERDGEYTAQAADNPPGTSLLTLTRARHGEARDPNRSGSCLTSAQKPGEERKREAKNVPGQLGLPLAVVFQTTKVRVNGRPSSLFFPRIGPGRHGWVGCETGFVRAGRIPASGITPRWPSH
jgi:hypothetical protein